MLAKFMTLILIVLTLFATPGAGLSQVATTAAANDEFELPAMILTTSNLLAAGAPDLGIFSIVGTALSKNQTVEDLINIDGYDDKEVRDVFTYRELDRSYRHLHALVDLNNPRPADATRLNIKTSVFEFASDYEATTSFEAVANLLGRGGNQIDAKQINQMSVLSSVTVESKLTKRVVPEYSLTFLSGRLIANVLVQDDGAGIDPLTVVELASRLDDRMYEVKTNGGPGLSTRAIQFQDDALRGIVFERYYFLNDEVLDSSDPSSGLDGIFHASEAAGAGATAVYGRWQLVTDRNVGDAMIETKVFAFPDEEWASKWLGYLAEEFVVEAEDEVNVERAPQAGDESFFFNVTNEEDPVNNTHFDAVRVGSYVAIITGTPLAPDVAREMLFAEADCLAGGGCAGPLKISDAPGSQR